MGSRRTPIRTPSNRALILLAGLPRGVAPGVANWLEQNLAGSPKVIVVPSSERDGKLYQPQTIDTCLRTVIDYSYRQTEIDGTTAPSSIILGFVPDDDTEDFLLDAFDFFVFPIPLIVLNVLKMASSCGILNQTPAN